MGIEKAREHVDLARKQWSDASEEHKHSPGFSEAEFCRGKNGF
jgi:hypothetical protein